MNTSKCPVCDWAINDGGIKVTVAGKVASFFHDSGVTVAAWQHYEKALPPGNNFRIFRSPRPFFLASSW